MYYIVRVFYKNLKIKSPFFGIAMIFSIEMVIRRYSFPTIFMKGLSYAIYGIYYLDKCLIN